MSVFDATDDIARPSSSGLVKKFAVAVLLLALIAFSWFLIKTLTAPAAPHKPTAQQIQLVRPNTPPPPPPPPKPQEKPPDPPKMKQETKIEEAKPKPEPAKAEAPPPAAKLGVDAAGTGEGDNFGLAANKGGRDITAAPQIGGTGGGAPAKVQYAFYRDVVTRHVNDELNRVSELKNADGLLAVMVWISRSGKIEKVDLKDASPEQAQLIRDKLMSSRAMREPPPESMPQPVWVLVNLRELG